MTARMQVDVDTVPEDARWEQAGLDALSRRAASAALTAGGLADGFYALCVMGCDDARIAGLNAAFRGKAVATNVLSWPSEDRASPTPGKRPPPPEPGTPDDPVELGDIAIAWETCVREAETLEKPFSDHVVHLIVHGTLHLLGYDHEDDSDAALMEETEVRALAAMGLANPYD
jgi:probable rRNA maturation factor